MRVLCCLLNYKTADMTEKALDLLLPEVRRIPGCRVMLVDNDSRDGSFEQLSARVKAIGADDVVEVVASGHNGGYGAGNNIALRRGLADQEPPDSFYLLNSDAFIEGQALSTLVDYLDHHPHVGMAGGYIHGVDGEPHSGAFRFPSLLSEIESSMRLGLVSKVLRKHPVPLSPPTHNPEAIDWVPGASMLIRRAVLEEVGLFHEPFFLYYEETDLCHRAAKAGYKVAFVRDASVAHISGASTGVKDLKKRTPRFLLDSRRHYFLKHHGPPYLWAANVAYAAGLASYRLRLRLQDKNDPDYEGALFDFVEHCVKHP